MQKLLSLHFWMTNLTTDNGKKQVSKGLYHLQSHDFSTYTFQWLWHSFYTGSTAGSNLSQRWSEREILPAAQPSANEENQEHFQSYIETSS